MELLQLEKCNKVAKFLYGYFIPYSFQHRRNVEYCILKDYEVIGLLMFQVVLGITVRTRFYRFLKKNQIIKLPEESRFNKICNRGGKLLHEIRLGIIKNLRKPQFTIIDSLPIPLCKYVRIHRAKVLNQYANIGYKATKKSWFYGLKGHFEINEQGIVVASAITKASVHDIKLTKVLLKQYSSEHVLADKGYLSRKLKLDLIRRGIQLWTPVRKNMKPYPYDCHLLFRLRKKIECVFAHLCRLFRIEHNLGRSWNGFQSRLEQCLLVDTLYKIKLL